MAINPLSDIVLDVARAVDPQSYRASVEKLQKPHDASSTNRFDDVQTSLTMAAMRPPVRVQDQEKLENPHRKFEAFMLQSLIMDMFSSDTSSVFGQGAGAEFWKGMLVEKMADEMAQNGGIGIASLMDERADAGKTHTLSTMDEAAASMIVNKNQINFMRYVSQGKKL